MGSGASTASAFRLRKALVIRAYNIRQKSSSGLESVSYVTLDEQFRPYSQIKLNIDPTIKSTIVITVDSIRQCLQMDSSTNTWIKGTLKELFPTSSESNSQEIDFYDFIYFLESGNLKPQPKLSSSKSAPILVHSLSSSTQASSTPSSSISGQHRHHSTTDYDDSSSISLPETISNISTNKKENIPSVSNNTTAIVLAAPRTIALNKQDAHRRPRQASDGKHMWKKRELIKQEKTIEYTTVDEDGQLQALVECEIHQTEILHMECRDTGEFAHRETTHFEQTEFFNNELVNERHGTEEYVHLKSEEDEIEYGESTMPRNEEEGVDDAPKSPRVGGDEEFTSARRGSIQGPIDIQEATIMTDTNIVDDDICDEAAQRILEGVEQGSVVEGYGYDDTEEGYEEDHHSQPYQFYNSGYASDIHDTARHPPTSSYEDTECQQQHHTDVMSDTSIQPPDDIISSNSSIDDLD